MDCLINTKCPLWFRQKKEFSNLVLWPSSYCIKTGEELFRHTKGLQQYIGLIKARLEVRSITDPHSIMCEPCQQAQRQELIFLICWPSNHLERRFIYPKHLHDAWVEHAANSPAIIDYLELMNFLEQFANLFMDRLLNRIYVDMATRPIFQKLRPNCSLPINPQSSWLKRPFLTKNHQPGFEKGVFGKMEIYGTAVDVDTFLKTECFVNKATKCGCLNDLNNTQQGFEHKLKGFLSNKESFLAKTNALEKTFQILHQMAQKKIDGSSLKSKCDILRSNSSNTNIFENSLNFQFEETIPNIINNVEIENLIYYETPQNQPISSAENSDFRSEKEEPIPGPSKINPDYNFSQPENLKRIQKANTEPMNSSKKPIVKCNKIFKKSDDPSKYKRQK